MGTISAAGAIGAGEEQVQTLIRLTERYCVVYQTLAHPAQLTVSARV